MNEKWTEDDKKYACPMNTKETFNDSYRDNMISSSTTPTPDSTPEISRVKILISVFSVLCIIMILAIILLIVFLV
jgi:hypothetical protein